MTGYVTRSGWGARAPTSTTPIGSTKGVAMHWEGTRMGSYPHSDCPGKVRSIQAYHMDANGWNDIAYNLLACPHDVVFEGRGAGKKSAANGDSQTNDDWYAVCALVGEGDPQPAALTTALQYAADLCRTWGAGPGVCGHRDLFNTACPGSTIYAQMQAGVFTAGGGDDMAGADDVLAKLDQHMDIEANRYGVYSNRYSDIVNRLNALTAQVDELTGTRTTPLPPVDDEE